MAKGSEEIKFKKFVYEFTDSFQLTAHADADFHMTCYIYITLG